MHVCIYCVQYLCLSANKVLSSPTSFAKFCGLLSYLACCHKRVVCTVVECVYVCVCLYVCMCVFLYVCVCAKNLIGFRMS